MGTKFRFAGEEIDVAPVRRDEALTIGVGDRELVIEGAVDQAAGPQRYVIDGRPCEVFAARVGDAIFVHVEGETWEVEGIDPVASAGAGSAGANAVRAPMPGVVVSVAVAPGDAVHSGAILMVIESMKLQTAIVAERDAVIEAVCFAVDATFDKGAELVRYAETDEA